MATQTAQIPPFSKFRGGFGLSSRAKDAKTNSGTDEDWYIPYNGPYEAPRQPARRRQARDSWGDPVGDYNADDSMLVDKELHLRYGGHTDFSTRSSTALPADERKSRSRDRALSVTSGQTTSSGAMDPNRASLAASRRSAVTTGNAPPAPSYASLDAMGGVGASPIPQIRSSRDNRISIASIFSFGGSGRRATSSHSNLKPPRKQQEGTYGRISPTSSESRRLLATNDSQFAQLSQTDKLSMTATDEDYYNTYYATLVNQSHDNNRNHQKPDYQPRSPSSSAGTRNSPQPQREHNATSRQISTSTSGHPYAYIFPPIESPEAPNTAPLISTPNPAATPGHTQLPQLTFATPQRSPSSAYAIHHSISPRSAGLVPPLKSSISTPNLRNQSTMPTANKEGISSKFSFPKGKDKWLSAETWCDALLFPRPRLKLKHDPVDGLPKESSGRIVSPPGSPLGPEFDEQKETREPGIASRVLAHSRSLVDLNKRRKIEDTPNLLHASTSKDPLIPVPRPRAQTMKILRPTSVARDNLALPTPVPSLADVIRETRLLDNERRAWQAQASSSFANKSARSMSRTRARSLTQNGRQGKHQQQSSIEYIAARACLGTQPLTPTIAPPKLSSSLTESVANTESTLSGGRRTHSHSNSVVKSLATKSSKSHSRGHSKSDSWGKSAIKMAKSTVICGYPSTDGTSSLNDGSFKEADLEGALRRNETKVIRLADPAYLPLDRGTALQNEYPVARQTPSPVNSRISDSKVGIALGSPGEDYVLNHPYAQGGLSFNNALTPSHLERQPDYAGPHPSINTGVKAPPISEIIARHKLPPHMVLHPYATHDSYIEKNGLVGQFRSEDATPNPSKMWAQLSPDVLREVLPGDLRYSPFMPDQSHDSPQDHRHTIMINDTIGVGETLVKAAEDRTAEHRPKRPIRHNNDDLLLPEFAPSFGRPGALFSDLLDVSQQSSDLSKNNGPASPHLEDMPMPSTDRAKSASPANTSDSSSHHSPRPLGSPNDLDSFQDLFYRPSPGTHIGRTPTEAALPDTPTPSPPTRSTSWDFKMPNRNTGTGSTLTSLARQLSEEFEQIERERSISQYSQSSTPSYRPGPLSRRHGDGSLQFVFEEMVPSRSSPIDGMDDAIHAFKPSETLPEDVQSSRASSLMENSVEDDPTARFRVGMIESVSTPPAYTPKHLSLEQTAFIHHRPEPHQEPESSHSHLSPGSRPLPDHTRSSYMTTSTTSRISRMSGLSDFPAPPKDDYHTSMRTSYFGDASNNSEARPRPLPRPPPFAERRVTFGDDQDANDVAAILSSPPIRLVTPSFKS